MILMRKGKTYDPELQANFLKEFEATESLSEVSRQRCVSMTTSIELRSDRVIVHLLGTGEEQQVLDYYVRNKEHLAPTDPPHPPGFHTLDFWAERVARSKVEINQDSAYRFVIKLPNDTSRIVGTVNLTQISRGPFQACYLGYGIDRDCEGKGIMTESLNLVIDYGFSKLNLHRIMANHLVGNTRSATLLKRLGFQQEGIAKAYLFISGEWRDHVLNSLTNAKWENTLEKKT
jgi:ribosomal-protein-alanine N-acetyltransferase